MRANSEIARHSFAKRNFSIINKNKFSDKLRAADWTHLFSINDTDRAFNYFIRKLKRIYNTCFPVESFVYSTKKSPWLSNDLLKSIKQKNTLFKKINDNAQAKETQEIQKSID
jgi:hypothetical protein